MLYAFIGGVMFGYICCALLCCNDRNGGDKRD